MKTRSVIVPFFLLAGSSACAPPSLASHVAEVGTGAPSAAAVSREVAEDIAEEPGMELVDRGAAPRTALRYRVAEGAVERFVLVQRQGQMPASVATKLTMTLHAKVIDPAGDRLWSYEVEHVDSDINPAATPALAGELRTSFAKMAGLGGTLVANDRGNPRKVEPRLPSWLGPAPTPFDLGFAEGLGSGLAESIGVVFVPLPAAAVGVGAQWDHHYDSRDIGIAIKVITHYQVVSIRGDEVKLKTTESQTATTQVAHAGGRGDFEIRNYEGEASGEVTLDLKHLSPRKSTRDGKKRMIMAGSGMAGSTMANQPIEASWSIVITGT